MHDEGSNQVSRISSPLGSESSPAKLLPPRPIFGAPRNKGAFFRSAGTPTISTPSAGKASYRSRLGGPICVVLVVISGWSTPIPAQPGCYHRLMEGGILESWNPGPEQMFHFVGKRKCRHGSSIMGMQLVLQCCSGRTTQSLDYC